MKQKYSISVDYLNQEQFKKWKGKKDGKNQTTYEAFQMMTHNGEPAHQIRHWGIQT